MRGWMNDERVMIVCCSDGTRPVIFKIERLDYKALYIDGVQCEKCQSNAFSRFSRVYIRNQPGMRQPFIINVQFVQISADVISRLFLAERRFRVLMYVSSQQDQFVVIVFFKIKFHLLKSPVSLPPAASYPGKFFLAHRSPDNRLRFQNHSLSNPAIAQGKSVHTYSCSLPAPAPWLLLRLLRMRL